MSDVRLVAAVKRGELRIVVLMLCPFGAGVSVPEYEAISDVPDYWPCTCGAEHSFSSGDVEMQFYRVQLTASERADGALW